MNTCAHTLRTAFLLISFFGSGSGISFGQILQVDGDQELKATLLQPAYIQAYPYYILTEKNYGFEDPLNPGVCTSSPFISLYTFFVGPPGANNQSPCSLQNYSASDEIFANISLPNGIIKKLFLSFLAYFEGDGFYSVRANIFNSQNVLINSAQFDTKSYPHVPYEWDFHSFSLNSLSQPANRVQIVLTLATGGSFGFDDLKVVSYILPSKTQPKIRQFELESIRNLDEPGIYPADSAY